MQNPEHARVQRTELNPWLVYLVSAMADECGYPALGRVGRAEPALHCVRPVVDHHVVSDHAKLDQQISTSVARHEKVRIMDGFPPMLLLVALLSGFMMSCCCPPLPGVAAASS